jgi:hypothetical protein
VSGLGEVAYEAYWGWTGGEPTPFDELTDEVREAWEAAARAVIARWGGEPEPEPE